MRRSCDWQASSILVWIFPWLQIVRFSIAFAVIWCCCSCCFGTSLRHTASWSCSSGVGFTFFLAMVVARVQHECSTVDSVGKQIHQNDNSGVSKTSVHISVTSAKMTHLLLIIYSRMKAHINIILCDPFLLIINFVVSVSVHHTESEDLARHDRSLCIFDSSKSIRSYRKFVFTLSCRVKTTTVQVTINT